MQVVVGEAEAEVEVDLGNKIETKAGEEEA